MCGGVETPRSACANSHMWSGAE